MKKKMKKLYTLKPFSLILNIIICFLTASTLNLIIIKEVLANSRLTIRQEFNSPSSFGCMSTIPGQNIAFTILIDKDGNQSISWDFYIPNTNSSMNIDFPKGQSFKILRVPLQQFSMPLDIWQEFQKAVNENEAFTVSSDIRVNRYPRTINTASFINSSKDLDLCVRTGTSIRTKKSQNEIDTGIILNRE